MAPEALLGDLQILLGMPFFQMALLGGCLATFVCSIMGLFIVLRKESMIGDSAAHTSFGGVAIGLLLGNKKARKFGGKAITYGGLAALGVIAYKAYNNWQQQQNGAAPQAQPQTVDRLPEAQAEVHSHAILQAIVGAAKADGHIDERERQMIEGEVAKLTSDREVQGWLERELNKPLDPAEIARAASTPEIAAEMYLASLLMVDEESFMERSYLEELARQLRLEPSFKLELENQARQALQRLA